MNEVYAAMIGELDALQEIVESLRDEARNQYSTIDGTYRIGIAKGKLEAYEKLFAHIKWRIAELEVKAANIDKVPDNTPVILERVSVESQDAFRIIETIGKFDTFNLSIARLKELYPDCAISLEPRTGFSVESGDIRMTFAKVFYSPTPTTDEVHNFLIVED